jgi:hypothetical protein
MAPAAPQCISGRTSYLRVRLAFHPYPQLIRIFCNRHRCGPPRPVTDASAWPWVAHTVSGLLHATDALFTLAFAGPPAVTALGGRHKVTRRVILQKARDHPCAEAPRALTAWTRSVSGSVSLPSPGCFSPFPHGTVRYRSRPVGCLGPWAAQLPTGLLVPRGTRDGCHAWHGAWYGTITRCGAPSQTLPATHVTTLEKIHLLRQVSQPRCRNAWMLGTASVWTAARFARHYSGPDTTSCGY